MPEREDCIDEIAKRTGRSRKDVEDELDELLSRSERPRHGGESPRDALAREALERLKEMEERAAIWKRARHIDAMKAITRQRAQRAAPTPRMGIEADIVGINRDFVGARDSAEKTRGVLQEKYLGGLVRGLEREGLMHFWASREMEKDLIEEIFQLNLRGGTPGITKNPQARRMAEIYREQLKTAVTDHNSEGGWIKSYNGYITKTTHDPDLIREAGRDGWVEKTLKTNLNIGRSFGTYNPAEARQILGQMWAPMKNGQHFELAPSAEPVFANIARRAAAHRELHWDVAKDWLAYNEQFGMTNPTETMVNALRTLAKQNALMQKWGTKPREALEEDLATHYNRLRHEDNDQFDELKKWEPFLRNAFNRLDGSADKPANRTWSTLASGWMTVQRMAKLLRAPFTHGAALPVKALALQRVGVGVTESYRRTITGMFRGAKGNAEREVADIMLAGMDAEMGFNLSRYDVSDSVPGILSKLDNWAHKLSGLTSITENSRRDASVAQAYHLGKQQGKDFNDLGQYEQYTFRQYGIGEAEWKVFHKAEWTKLEGKTYLTPNVLEHISDADIRSYLEEKNAAGTRVPAAVLDADVAKGREDLIDKLHGMYWDQARYAIFEPGVKVKAHLYGGLKETRPNIAVALHLLYQFRVWPAEMLARSFARELYGGYGKMDQIAGITQLVVASAIYGSAFEALREMVQLQNPVERFMEHPWKYLTRGLLRSGAATMAGDYLFGEFDRHGLSFWASALGPTFGQIEGLFELKNHIAESFTTGNWRPTETQLLHMVRGNIPLVDMWWTFKAFDYLVTYQLMDWINPGYLRRMERRMKEKQGIQFLVSPQRVSG